MIKSSIWITGATGRLGSALVNRIGKSSKYTLIATDKDVDITDMEEVKRAATVYQPSIIINCAALSSNDYCEDNMVEAFKVNAIGARNIATVARQHNAKLIHISTDDVFLGDKHKSLTEFDPPTPKRVYGRSKLAGENYVKELCPKHVIIRSSWMYGAENRGDYFGFVMDKAAKNEKFRAPLNKISTPTCVNDVVDFIVHMLENNEYGIFHASAEGSCTRYDFARAILEATGNDVSLVEGVYEGETHNLTSTALENLMMKLTDVYEMPEWRASLKEYVESIK